MCGFQGLNSTISSKTFHKIFKYSFFYELINSKSTFIIPFHQKKKAFIGIVHDAFLNP